jgi:hypothetical protein
MDREKMPARAGDGRRNSGRENQKNNNQVSERGLGFD